LIPLSEVPYQAQLNILDGSSKSFQCGGSIISTNFILSAAHCVTGLTEKNLIVRIGTNYRLLGGEMFRVKKITIHPNYDNSIIDFDFSLLELEKEIKIKTGQKEIIQMPQQDDTVADGSLVFASGWGETKNIKEPVNLLRGVTLSVIDNTKCKSAWNDLTDQMLCAGSEKGDKDACSGKFDIFDLNLVRVNLFCNFQAILEVKIYMVVNITFSNYFNFRSIEKLGK
jgi:trypsin